MTATTDKPSTEQRVIEALSAQEATVDEVAAAVGIGRTSARKYLAGLKQAGKVKRSAGGREGKRKLPDRYSLADKEPAAASRPEPEPRKGSGERLGPGKLDSLVLNYLGRHAEEGPLSASAVGKGLARSSGAVANCLKRLAEAGKVSQASERPRRYEIAS
jgi:predicted transcriptional regulator